MFENFVRFRCQVQVIRTRVKLGSNGILRSESRLIQGLDGSYTNPFRGKDELDTWALQPRYGSLAFDATTRALYTRVYEGHKPSPCVYNHLAILLCSTDLTGTLLILKSALIILSAFVTSSASYWYTVQYLTAVSRSESSCSRYFSKDFTVLPHHSSNCMLSDGLRKLQPV